MHLIEHQQYLNLFKFSAFFCILNLNISLWQPNTDTLILEAENNLQPDK